MAKIIRVGWVLPEEPPPEGLRARCRSCGAEIETEENEPEWLVKTEEERQTFYRYWVIPCPVCRKWKVYIAVPSDWVPRGVVDRTKR